MKLYLSLLVVLLMADACWSLQCTAKDWYSSFYRQGWSTCDTTKEYITGLYRHDRISSSDDPIHQLEKADCCSVDLKSSCVNADWRGVLDKENSWALCPNGYFLNGLYRTDTDDNLHDIKEGRCCKPDSLPCHYGDCYDEDVYASFDHKGWSYCNKSGYYLTGIYKSDCNYLYCIEKFKCCNMV
ncbi:hypothetical protein ACROYT_G002469 [Oculina patagonica]